MGNFILQEKFDCYMLTAGVMSWGGVEFKTKGRDDQASFIFCLANISLSAILSYISMHNHSFRLNARILVQNHLLEERVQSSASMPTTPSRRFANPGSRSAPNG